MSYNWNAPARSGSVEVVKHEEICLTLQFFIHAAATRDAESANELPEVDRSAVVLVYKGRDQSLAQESIEAASTKDFEDVFGERFRVAEREELLVDARKFFLVELARGTILQEAFVPVMPSTSALSTRAKGASGEGGSAPLLELLLVDCRACPDLSAYTSRLSQRLERTVSVLLEVTQVLWGQF